MKVIKSKAIAEFIGTFSLVFSGCGSIMILERFENSIHPSSIPIIFGLVISSMIYTVGHISGAHFNPAVTLAFAITRHFPKREVLIYWFAQFTGAFLAITLLSFLLPHGQNFGATLPHIEPFKAMIYEVILSFFLMLVIISVATDTRAVGMMAGMAIGGTVALCAFIGGPITGASMNPARSLAPNLFQGEISSLWIYFAGPFLGCLIAALTYNSIKCNDINETQNAKGCC